jgi:hypothetical protein
MRFAADYSENLEVFFTPTNGISGHLYVSQSVVCEMATVQERALCVGWLLETKSVNEMTAHSSISNLRVSMQ